MMLADILANAMEDQPASVADSTDQAVLDRIREPDVHLALWHRALPHSLSGLDRLDWDGIDDIDCTIDCAALESGIVGAIDEAGYPRTGEVDALARDVTARAAHFARIMMCAQLRLRLELIDTDACWKFHADTVTARLLMPIFGPGPQWIVVRDQPFGPVHELAPGEVGIFKGRLWTETPAILHRSPPLGDSGRTRLLLALEPAADVAGKAQHG